MSADEQAGSIGASGAPAGLSVARDDQVVTSTGAGGLTYADDGSVAIRDALGHVEVQVQFAQGGEVRTATLYSGSAPSGGSVSFTPAEVAAAVAAASVPPPAPSPPAAGPSTPPRPAGAPAHATLHLGAAAAVSRTGVAALRLTCAGPRGARDVRRHAETDGAGARNGPAAGPRPFAEGHAARHGRARQRAGHRLAVHVGERERRALASGQKAADACAGPQTERDGHRDAGRGRGRRWGGSERDAHRAAPAPPRARRLRLTCGRGPGRRPRSPRGRPPAGRRRVRCLGPHAGGEPLGVLAGQQAVERGAEDRDERPGQRAGDDLRHEVAGVGAGRLGDGGGERVGLARPADREPLLQRGAVAHDAGDDEAVPGRAGGHDVEHRLGVRAEDVEHRRAGRALRDRRLQLGQPLLAAGEDEVLLGGEVVEDRLLGDVGGDGDLGDRDGVEAALCEQAARGGGDRVVRGALLAFTQAWGASPGMSIAL